MRVKYIKTGAVVEVNDCYGARLVEQGKAVPVSEQDFPMNAPEEAEETKKTKAGKKGE
ncbi:MAG: hypothetical protein IJV91_10605 [Kiritimatiellae bacterium]|nr:hypothetical protein [Kiritimatiellia bacterium]